MNASELKVGIIVRGLVLPEPRIEGESIPRLEGNIHLDELNNRLEGRRAELAVARSCH
jgi:hypothetical protein